MVRTPTANMTVVDQLCFVVVSDKDILLVKMMVADIQPTPLICTSP